MTHTATIRHNAEAAHRLPFIPGKCENLHGHSWWFEVTVEAPELAAGIIVECGAFKAKFRQWVDEHLDHGAMLGPEDPLLPVLQGMGSKVHVVDGWPTVENVAVMVAAVATDCLQELVRAPGARVVRVDVQETHVNGAGWSCAS